MSIENNKIILYLPYKNNISLKIYDIAGRLVNTAFYGEIDPGTYKFNLPNKVGVYFAILNYMDRTKVLKFTKLL